MLTSLHIQGFKGFKDTKVEELRKVNLILGGQNAGKTSLLEAAALVFNNRGSGVNRASINSIPSLFRVSEDLDQSRYWKSIFDDGSVRKQIKITYALDDLNYIRRVGNGVGGAGVFLNGVENIHCHDTRIDVVDFRIELPDQKIPLPVAFSTTLPKQSELVRLYGEAVKKKLKKSLLKLLKKIEPRLDSLDVVAPDGEYRIYVDLDAELQMIPMPQLGSGFARIFSMYCELLVTNSNLALIDEIENGIHYSALPTVFRGIREIAESKDVQSMITTHSWECVRAACEVFKDKPEDFQAIRLERDGDNIVAVCIPGDRVLRMVEQDMEIR